jgi:type III pantothenate kinase
MMASMILAIDAGNSRIKWALHNTDPHSGGLQSGSSQPATGNDVRALRIDDCWQMHGVTAVSELEQLHEAWSGLPAPTHIAIANVAGPTVRETLLELIQHWNVQPQWLQSQAEAGGVKNRYVNPLQLGVDRWAALVAAWVRVRRECLVVMAGTATTIDVLNASGEFSGGLILPGLGLMKRSLSEHTAALSLASGVFSAQPLNTADAIESGCVNAQLGAIERMHRQLAADAPCLISGGGASALAPHLSMPLVPVEHLVLEGVLHLAC